MERESLGAALARRELLRLAALAGLGSALIPRLARAAADPPNMPHVAALVDRWVGPGKFPGMVAALGLPGQDTRYAIRGTDGFLDLDPLSPDSLFRIYSMTKPVTGFAAMMLIDEGRLSLDQPVADILPRFARMQVQVTPDGPIDVLRPAKTPITVRHLLTHTSGLGYSIVQKGPIRAAYQAAGLIPGRISRMNTPGWSGGNVPSSLAVFADRLAAMPLVYEPGTHWSYGMGLDLLGRVIEVVSGQPFDAFLSRRLFEPLGMTSTFFQVPSGEAKRLTTNFAVVKGHFIAIDPGDTSVFLDKPPFPFGGSGLVSSPRDYDRFLLMLANFGQVGGVRVLSEAAVRAGTGNLLPAGVSRQAMIPPVGDFGAGGRVGVGAEAGIFGWAGAAGTVGTVDMRRGIRSGIYAQFMSADPMQLLPEYQQALREDVMALIASATGSGT